MTVDRGPPADAAGLTTYEGWVAWVGGRPRTTPDGRGGHQTAWEGGRPIFEAVPGPRPDLPAALPGARDLEARPRDRRNLTWGELPHEEVNCLELYFARDVFADQPVARIDRPQRAAREPGWRWLQMKLGGVAAPSGPAADLEEQRRTGIQGWRIGYYNPFDQGGPVAGLVEVRPGDGAIEPEEIRGHPCWPRPLGGWGIAPRVLGLRPHEVPDPPSPREVIAEP